MIYLHVLFPGEKNKWDVELGTACGGQNSWIGCRRCEKETKGQ